MSLSSADDARFLNLAEGVLLRLAVHTKNRFNNKLSETKQINKQSSTESLSNATASACSIMTPTY